MSPPSIRPTGWALVTPLTAITLADARSTGAKAATLGALLQAGLPVPAGVCVTTAAFERFLETDPPVTARIEELARLRAGDTPRICALGSAIRTRLSALPVPEDIAVSIRDACAALGTTTRYAVRSSATSEDLADASCAGQHDSFLDVPYAEIVDHVRACWASLFTERALLYRAQRHRMDASPAMAVIVQVMVESEIAGVAFTADPVRGDPGCLTLEWVPGLGASLVSGRATPDRVVLSRSPLQIIARCGAGEQGVSLADSEAYALARLALQTEARLGCPQDIEWAVTRRERFLLQARPITALPRAHRHDRTVWSNVNVGELLPQVATPMSWAVVQQFTQQLFSPFLTRLGIDMDKEPLIGLVAGRVYANVNTFACLVRRMSGPGQMDLNQVFGGMQDAQAAAELTAFLDEAPPVRWPARLALRLRFLGLALWILQNASIRKGRRYIDTLRDALGASADADIETRDDEALIPSKDDWARHGLRNAPAIGGIVVGMGCTTTLFRKATAWLGDDGSALANRLLSHTGGMESSEPARALWRLARWTQERPELASRVASAAQWADLAACLHASADGHSFLVQWQAWLRAHGHHTAGELDVAQARWSEDPDAVLKMLQAYVSHAGAIKPLLTRDEAARDHAQSWETCRRRLRNPLRRWAFHVLLNRARAGLVLRENLKNQAIRLIAAIRRNLLELGIRLQRRHIIQERDDIFFLTPDELLAIVRGKNLPTVKTSVATRRAEYREDQRCVPPPVVVGHFTPTQDNAPPRETTSEWHGLAVSAGVATGPARVMTSPDEGHCLLPGEILVAPFTDPGWAPYFLPAAAIVMDMGGMLSHGCIVAREYGIPAVVNVGPATRHITTGQMLHVDGNRGLVRVLDGEKTA